MDGKTLTIVLIVVAIAAFITVSALLMTGTFNPVS
jgi:hypothetical protein